MSNVALRPAARFEVLGGVGVSVTAGGSINTKGSWATIGTTGFDYDGFLLTVGGSGGTSRLNLLDLGLGATPDIIMSDLHFLTAIHFTKDFPLRVPAGTAIKARTASTTASNAVQLTITGYKYDHLQLPPFSRAEQIAALNAGSYPDNVVTQTGTTPTAWTEIVAAAARNYRAVMPTLSPATDTTRTAAGFVLEVGKGAGGAEVSALQFGGRNEATHVLSQHPIMPLAVKAGERLSYRITMGNAAADDIACGLMGFW